MLELSGNRRYRLDHFHLIRIELHIDDKKLIHSPSIYVFLIWRGVYHKNDSNLKILMEMMLGPKTFPICNNLLSNF